MNAVVLTALMPTTWRDRIITPPRQRAPLAAGTLIVAALFAASSVVHFLAPEVFEEQVPHVLPQARLLVLVSGAAELACAVGLLVPATRRAAGWASAALLIAIFPANIQMAIDARGKLDRLEVPPAYYYGTLVRLPLQLPLIWWAYRAARPRTASSR